MWSRLATKGCYVGENVRLVNNIIWYTKIKKTFQASLTSLTLKTFLTPLSGIFFLKLLNNLTLVVTFKTG